MCVYVWVFMHVTTGKKNLGCEANILKVFLSSGATVVFLWKPAIKGYGTPNL